MRIVGVIAEYNPFHSGHARHLALAREASGADAVIAVMSGCFVQRGEPALLSPAARAECALKHGADAVVLLPACWSLRDAQHFAKGAVALLKGLGVAGISFGAETPEADLLSDLADALNSISCSSVEMESALRSGMPWPEAVSSALAQISPKAAAVLQLPNNLLGISYIRAAKDLGAELEVYPIPRTGCHDQLAGNEESPSALLIRDRIQNGSWRAVRHMMPEDCFRVLQNEALNERLCSGKALDHTLIACLRSMPPEAWSALPGLSEGIENRLADAAGQSCSFAALMDAAKTRRYPLVRLKRLAMHALLGITSAQLEAEPLPTHAILLGYRKSREDLLSRLSGQSLPLIVRRKDLPMELTWAQTEQRAWDLHSFLCRMPSGMLHRQGIIRLPD